VESATQIARAATATALAFAGYATTTSATAANGKVIAANASEAATTATTKISAAGKCVGGKRGAFKNKGNCKSNHNPMHHV
jgi:hypothetical protein